MLATRPDSDKKVQLNKSLWEHASRGSLEGVQLCLSQGADPNHQEGTSTPILLASLHGHTAVVDCLLSAGADFARVLTGAYRTGEYLKIFAVATPKLASRLIENLAAHSDINNYQTISYHVERISRLLDNKALGKQLAKQYKNLLLEQVTQGEKRSYAFATNLGIEIDHILNQQFLAYAATNNFEAMKDIATQSGVYLDYKIEVKLEENSPKFTALFWAINYERLDMVEWLATKSTFSSSSALFTVDAYKQAERKNPVIGDKILDVIAANTNKDNFDETLRKLGDCDTGDLKMTAAQHYLSKLILLPTSKSFRDRIDQAQQRHNRDHLAFEFLCSVRDRDLAGAKKHLESGVDVDCQLFGMKHNFRGAIISAVENEQIEMLELLLLHKARTHGALQLAVQKSNLAIAELLLNNNANPNTKVYDDHQEISLLSFALKKSSEDMIKLLLKAMASQTNDDNYSTTLADIEKSDHHEAHDYAMYFLAALIALNQNKNAEETSIIRHAKITLWTKLFQSARAALDRNDFEAFNDCVTLETKVFKHSSPEEKLYARGITHCVETRELDKVTRLLTLGTSKAALPAVIHIVRGKPQFFCGVYELAVFFTMLEKQRTVMIKPEDCISISNYITQTISPKNRKFIKVLMTEYLSKTEQSLALEICERVLADSSNSVMAKIFRIKKSESSSECQVNRGSLKDIDNLAKKLRKLVPIANRNVEISGNANVIPAVAMAVAVAPIASQTEAEDSPPSPNSLRFNLFKPQTTNNPPQPSADYAIEMKDLGTHSHESGSRKNSLGGN